MSQKQQIATIQVGSCVTIIGVLTAGPYPLLGKTGQFGKVESNGLVFSGEIIALREEEVEPKSLSIVE